MQNKPIEIFVRHCYYSRNAELPNRGRPEWFSKGACWENLKRTTNHELANITVIYDKHFGLLPDNKSYYKGHNLIEGECGTEAGSFLEMLRIIRERNLPPETIVYLLENDYLHREGWCEVLMEAFTLPVHYVTLYDHLDKYLHYPALLSRLYATETCHWRTTPSTTNTYACKISQLMADMDTHEQYSLHSNNGVSRDSEKFERLTNLDRILVSSVPGYSTHCDGLMSPTIDWEKISNFTTYG